MKGFRFSVSNVFSVLYSGRDERKESSEIKPSTRIIKKVFTKRHKARQRRNLRSAFRSLIDTAVE